MRVPLQFPAQAGKELVRGKEIWIGIWSMNLIWKTMETFPRDREFIAFCCDDGDDFCMCVAWYEEEDALGIDHGRGFYPPSFFSLWTDKPQTLEFVVLDGKMLVADVLDRDGDSITANLYRNLNDFRQGTTIERAVSLKDQSS